MKKLLDENIVMQRAMYAAAVPGMLEDLNEKTKNPTLKSYLR